MTIASAAASLAIRGSSPARFSGKSWVAAPPVLGEDGIEFFRVEIEEVDVVAPALEPFERRRAENCVKALRQRTAVDIEDAHGPDRGKDRSDACGRGRLARHRPGLASATVCPNALVECFVFTPRRAWRIGGNV